MARRGLFALVAIFGIAAELGAQGAVGTGRRSLASRADLEAAAKSAEQLARSSGDAKVREQKSIEAAQLRLRLREGDFQPGHSILLSVLEDSSLSDTFTVRSDRKLLLPNLPEISLVGVLDSELESFLAKEIAKYVKTPTVRASALLRVSVLGAVGAPGFYALPTDALVSDAIMLAGGPTSNANLKGSVIRRGNAVALNKSVVQNAFQRGLTLADVGVRPGDEISVPDNQSGRWQRIATGVTAASGLIFTSIWLARRF